MLIYYSNLIMADVFTPKKRSWNMSRIRSKHTSPELQVRQALSGLGLKYRLHVKSLPGNPDIVFRKYKTVIFINGCFWHQHKGCKRATSPKSNIDYWKPKLKRNIQKQKENFKEFKKLGWKTVIIWECEAKREDILNSKINRIFSQN